MKLQHLRVLDAVIESGGVVAGAQRLHASQPAVSIALRALEEELGEPLFQRPGGGKRLIPTAKALRFHNRALEILRQCEAARAEFRERRDRVPRLRLGVMPTIAKRDVASVNVILQQGNPGWRFQLREAPMGDLPGHLRRGRVDAAWTCIEEDGEHARVLWREDFVALVGREHRLARHRGQGVTLRDLDGERIVLRSSCELRSGRLEEAGIALQIAARVARDELALSLVANGIGIAIAPLSFAEGEVVAVPISDLGVRRSIGLAWRPELPEPLLLATLDAITNQYLRRSDDAEGATGKSGSKRMRD